MSEHEDESGGPDYGGRRGGESAGSEAADRAVKVRPRGSPARSMPMSKEPNPATLVAEAQLKVNADNRRAPMR